MGIDPSNAEIAKHTAELAKRVNVAITQEKPDASFVKHWGENLKCDPRADYAGALLEAGRVDLHRQRFSAVIGANVSAAGQAGRHAYAGTPDGRTYLSVDGGASFIRIPMPAGINGGVERIFVDPSDSGSKPTEPPYNDRRAAVAAPVQIVVSSRDAPR